MTLDQPASGVNVQASLFPYRDTKAVLDKLLSDWESTEKKSGEKRRELRRNEYDVQALRERGELSPNDTIVPQRVIDRSIRQEKPAQLAILEQPDRILIFQDMTDPHQVTDDLEKAFTKFARYPSWNIPWHRTFDSVELHGGSPIEVVFAPNRPLHADVEFIAREDLIFHDKTKSLQQQEFILRRYCYLPYELESFVASKSFSQPVVDKVTKDKKGAHRLDSIDVYKVYTKKDGVVYIGWFLPSADDWLKEPAQLQLGIYDINELVRFQQTSEMMQESPFMMEPPMPPKEAPLAEYPIFYMLLEIIEDETLLGVKGRAFRDAPDQEASTELLSALVNAARKAAKVYASAANDPMNGPGQLKETVPIKDDMIYGRKVDFWSMPMPDPQVFALTQGLSVNKQAELSRPDFAVNNRQDSRKTATEITAANQQALQLTSVAVVGPSKTILEAYSLIWEIARCQILLGAIEDFPISKERCAHNYRLATAGDTDLASRQERKQLITLTYQYLANTPLGPLFLKYIVEAFFPEKAQEWLPVLDAGDPTQIIAQIIPILQQVPRDNLTPEQSLQLDQLTQLIANYVGIRTPAAGVPARTQGLAEPPADTESPEEDSSGPPAVS